MVARRSSGPCTPTLASSATMEWIPETNSTTRLADWLQYGCCNLVWKKICRIYVFPANRNKKKSRRADSNRLPLLQLRVITQALQGCAGDCKYRIFRGVSFLCLAACCTVLRSQWYQIGIRISRLARTVSRTLPESRTVNDGYQFNHGSRKAGLSREPIVAG
jgi:hypothetical protein